MGYVLTGDQQKTANRRLGEILRQFGQDEYPYDPEAALDALQAFSEGQWREAFKAAFPRPDGNGPIGITDSSWVDPRGFASFPGVDSGGVSNFFWAVGELGEYWRWLVPASK